MVDRARDKTLIMMTFQSHSHIIQGQECQREREGEKNDGRDCVYVQYMYSVYRHKVNDVWHYTGDLN